MSLCQAMFQFGCSVWQGGCDSLINIQSPGCFRVSKTAAFKLFLLQPRIRNKFYTKTQHTHHTTPHTHTHVKFNKENKFHGTIFTLTMQTYWYVPFISWPINGLWLIVLKNPKLSMRVVKWSRRETDLRSLPSGSGSLRVQCFKLLSGIDWTLDWKFLDKNSHNGSEFRQNTQCFVAGHPLSCKPCLK